MIATGLVLTGAAALLHVFIFYLESVVWTTKARAVFGTSAAEAEATKEMARQTAEAEDKAAEQI